MTEITEIIGRSALLAAASNYRSVAEALMELVDNPFDKRRGRHLTIDVVIDKKGDRVVITDQGGEGMNDAGLQGWIRWGEGEQHATDDIGQYHVGGKLAAIYLAEEIDIVCRKAGEDAIWRFHDPRWGSRTTALNASPLARVGGANLRWPDGRPAAGDGFTRVTLRGLKEHRYDIANLRERLSDTYRSLIERKQCTIRVNGEQVGTRHIPWSSTIKVVEIPRTEVFKGVTVTGRVGAIDRDQIPDTRIRIPAGVRTEFNGRKITDGEEFGHKLSGKGNLQRVYGEIEIQGRGLKPNQLKNGWPQDSEGWTALDAVMKEHMAPIVAHLGRISEARPATREERKRANNARRRVQDALKQLQMLRNGIGGDSDADGEGPGGRKSSKTTGEKNTSTNNNPDKPRGPVKIRTRPPEDAVGRLLRRVGGMPQVIYDSLGQQTERTQWRFPREGRGLRLRVHRFAPRVRGNAVGLGSARSLRPDRLARQDAAGGGVSVAAGGGTR